MKVILCGYHWTGCKALEILLKNNAEVFVYTHDNPYYVNSLKSYCIKKNIPYNTEKITTANLPFVPDVICSIYYRDIISRKVIEACDGKIFNLHPSLLPQYKGCSSLTWAMIEGEEYVGYSYHYLTPDVDGGDILVQEKMRVEVFDTQASLYYRVMFEAMKQFYDVVLKVSRKEAGHSQQGQASYFQRGAPYNGEIDPTWDDQKIDNFIRAMVFPPLPLATCNGAEIYSLAKFKEITNDKV